MRVIQEIRNREYEKRRLAWLKKQRELQAEIRDGIKDGIIPVGRQTHSITRQVSDDDDDNGLIEGNATWGLAIRYPHVGAALALGIVFGTHLSDTGLDIDVDFPHDLGGNECICVWTHSKVAAGEHHYWACFDFAGRFRGWHSEAWPDPVIPVIRKTCPD